MAPRPLWNAAVQVLNGDLTSDQIERALLAFETFGGVTLGDRRGSVALLTGIRDIGWSKQLTRPIHRIEAHSVG